MLVAIIGSRSIDDRFYKTLCSHVPIGASEIISGGAAGADQLGIRYAQENGLRYTVFEPDYEKYGKRAPLMRNRQIIERADYVLALWDGRSRGTAHSINLCLETYTPVRVITCKEEEPDSDSEPIRI